MEASVFYKLKVALQLQFFLKIIHESNKHFLKIIHNVLQ